MPKRGLVSGLQAMLEMRQIELPANYAPLQLLGRELANIGTRMNERGRVRFGPSREGNMTTS